MTTTKTLIELRHEADEISRTVSRREPGGAERLAAAQKAWADAARAELLPRDLTDAQWDLVFNFAWRVGHSGGYSEVEGWISELSDLVTKVIDAD